MGFGAQPFVIRHLTRSAGQSFDELTDFQRILLYFHPPRFQPHEVKQVINQFQKAHAIGMHRAQQLFRIPIEIEPVNQRLQRRDKQRQRRAQFVTDICKEAALHLVQLNQLAMAFFDDLAIAFQLEPQYEFAEAKPAVEIAARDNDYPSTAEEKEVISQVGGFPPPPREGDAYIAAYNQNRRRRDLFVSPWEDDADREQYQVESCVIRRAGVFGRINHTADKDHRNPVPGHPKRSVIFVGPAAHQKPKHDSG